MTKDELQKIIYLDDRMNSKLRQLKELKLTRENVKGIDYSKEKVQSNPINMLEATVIKMIETEEEINESIDKLVDLKNHAREKINQVEGVNGTVLEMRYLECMSFEEIAYRLNYSIQHIHRLHGQALVEIKEQGETKDESKCD